MRVNGRASLIALAMASKKKFKAWHPHVSIVQKVSSIDISENTQVTTSETKSSPLKSVLGSDVKCPFEGAYFQFSGELFLLRGGGIIFG